MKLSIKTHCKINLLLNVVGDREDGFHELEMLMLPVPIFDILKIELTGSRINLNCNHPQIPNGHENLAYQAAEKFRIKAQISDGIRIDLEKNIPVEAGLGGGSGNAAGILLALNKLHDHALNTSTMQEIASSLGSDVPFFLQHLPAIAKGRGEIIDPVGNLSLLEGKALVLVRPKFGISTPWAYKNLSYFPAAKQRPLGQAKDLALALKKGLIQKAYKNFYNSLELPVFNKFPLIKIIKEYALAHGAESALMCGSGSTVFAICSNNSKAELLSESFKSNFDPLAMNQIITLPGEINPF